MGQDPHDLLGDITEHDVSAANNVKESLEKYERTVKSRVALLTVLSDEDPIANSFPADDGTSKQNTKMAAESSPFQRTTDNSTLSKVQQRVLFKET